MDSYMPKVYAPIAANSDTPRDLRDRFGDILNVKDFGAVGNGETDDTIAFQRVSEYVCSFKSCSSASERLVFIPSGKYILNADVDGFFVCMGGVSFLGSGKLTLFNMFNIFNTLTSNDLLSYLPTISGNLSTLASNYVNLTKLVERLITELNTLKDSINTNATNIDTVKKDLTSLSSRVDTISNSITINTGIVGSNRKLDIDFTTSTTSSNDVTSTNTSTSDITSDNTSDLTVNFDRTEVTTGGTNG